MLLLSHVQSFRAIPIANLSNEQNNLNPELILASAAVSFIVAATLMLALRPLAFRVRLIDAPGGRKLHSGDIPITGGLAMFCGIFVGISVLSIGSNFAMSLLASSFILVAVGVLDDRFHIAPVARLLSQVIAILVMYSGAELFLADIGDPFGTGILETGRLSLVMTMLVFIAMINAYNFVDGADGLAGLLSVIGLLAVVVVSGLFHPTGAIALIVAAAVVGFLIFNFPTTRNRPFRAFMGDGGSTLLGFLLAWLVLSISQGPERLISPVHCLWFSAVPIFDFFTCFVRRLRLGKSPFTPGRDHFHHILENSGAGVRQTLSILTGLQLLYAVIGLAGYYLGIPDVVMFTAWSLLGLTQILVIVGISKYFKRRSGPVATSA
jgi:UDP-GlcNAc:undecaprenyl-phosphate GlcNAc-1-phosphate transferase